MKANKHHCISFHVLPVDGNEKRRRHAFLSSTARQSIHRRCQDGASKIPFITGRRAKKKPNIRRSRPICAATVLVAKARPVYIALAPGQQGQRRTALPASPGRHGRTTTQCAKEQTGLHRIRFFDKTEYSSVSSLKSQHRESDKAPIVAPRRIRRRG